MKYKITAGIEIDVRIPARNDPGSFRLSQKLSRASKAEPEQMFDVIEDILRQFLVPPDGMTVDQVLDSLSLDDINAIFEEISLPFESG